MCYKYTSFLSLKLLCIIRRCSLFIQGMRTLREEEVVVVEEEVEEMKKKFRVGLCREKK
jgi:hypothetical protein